MNINQWSQYSQIFKTITSDSDTRNPTTIKKNQIAGCKKKVRHSQYIRPREAQEFMGIPEIEKRISQLQAKKQILIDRKSYEKVKKIEQKIEALNKQLKEEYPKILRNSHLIEQSNVYEVHKEEMREFRKVWNDIFNRYEHKKQEMIRRIEEEQRLEVLEVSAAFMKKVERVAQSQSKNNKSLRQLNEMEHKMLKMGQYEDLALMNFSQRRRKVRTQLKQERNYLIDHLQNLQESRLKTKYEKRYNSLSMKIREGQECQQKIFKHQEQIIKQRFLNNLKKLQKRQKKQALSMTNAF